MVVPGQGWPYAGDTAVLGHFSPIGPLFGPQMGRYVPDPQRGECAADLGLAAGAKKLRGTRAEGAGGGSEGALRAYTGRFGRFLQDGCFPNNQTRVVDRPISRLLGPQISGLNSFGEKYTGRSKWGCPNWTESAAAHSGMDFFPKLQNRHEISYVNYLWRPYLQVYITFG